MRILLKVVFCLVAIPLTFGAALALLIYPFMRRSRFFRTFEHELTHMIAAKVFFAKMESLKVHASGNGEVRYSRASNFVIALAPYFLPLFASVLLVLIPIIDPKIAVWFLVPVGFLLAHHLVASLEEAFSGQPDISEPGRVFSIFVIALFGILVYGAFISFAAGGGHQAIGFYKSIPAKSWWIATTWVPSVYRDIHAMLR